jgi:hypothetical protein
MLPRINRFSLIRSGCAVIGLLSEWTSYCSIRDFAYDLFEEFDAMTSRI